MLATPLRRIWVPQITKHFAKRSSSRTLQQTFGRHPRSHRITNFTTMAQRGSDYLVWVDLEMTGLNLSKDSIIEMAVIVTDKDLNIVAQGPNLIIHQDKALMDSMDEWCTKTHGESGLTQSVLDSTLKTEEVEDIMLGFISKYVEPRTAPLAGNSVHQDRRFLEKEMPRFLDYLHYRIVDVSTIKEVTRRWFPNTYLSMPPKKGGHRALDDIQESITELKWYQNNIFKPGLN